MPRAEAAAFPASSEAPSHAHRTILALLTAAMSSTMSPLSLRCYLTTGTVITELPSEQGLLPGEAELPSLLLPIKFLPPSPSQLQHLCG